LASRGGKRATTAPPDSHTATVESSPSSRTIEALWEDETTFRNERGRVGGRGAKIGSREEGEGEGERGERERETKA
jgi:hypothetical protein